MGRCHAVFKRGKVPVINVNKGDEEALICGDVTVFSEATPTKDLSTRVQRCVGFGICPQQDQRIWARTEKGASFSVSSAVPCAMRAHDCRQLAPWRVPTTGLTKRKVR